MDEEIKISEMLEAENINEEDFIPIIQNGVNKKISASKVGNGNGVPTGGTTGQVLTKSSNEDNEVYWEDPVETQVINNLNSSSTTSALSANQGKVLNNKIENLIEYGNITANQMANASLGGQAGKIYELTFKNSYTEIPTVVATFYSQEGISYYGFIQTQVVSISKNKCTLCLNVQGLTGNRCGISYMVIGK